MTSSPHSASRPSQNWEIFCTVIDNYGDIGVAWRLASQLAREHALGVRLWVDDLTAFARIRPDACAQAGRQIIDEVEIRHWQPGTFVPDPGTVVIEAFGCALPETQLAAMAAAPVAPVWINLEYLTAEAWAGSHHGLPSPHPRWPLTRHFFFPGYRPDTGGLLREAGLIERAALGREAARRDWGIPDAVRAVSLFAYENPALPALFDAWSAGNAPLLCLVPEGRSVPQVAAWFGEAGLVAGAVCRRGALEVRVLPFVAQTEYDRLLWACDVNFVRGEDSCVRAQWAGQPFVWQAYPQAGGAHRAKLDALFGLHTAGWATGSRAALAELWAAWNGFAPPQTAAAAWEALAPADWARSARAWRDTLAARPDLATRLVHFVAAQKASVQRQA